MLIGIISDTHGLLRQEVKDGLKGVDMIIHGGDIDCQSVLDQLKEISSSMTVVRGNADKEWAEHLSQSAWVEILGNKIFVIHNKGKISEDIGDADIIIYGHSHKYSLVEKDGQTWFNPGCCGKRKPGQEISFAILEIRGKGDFEFRKMVIGNDQAETKLPKDIDIYYCHKGRRTYTQWDDYKNAMIDRIPDAKPVILTFHKGTQRSYIFLIHSEDFVSYRKIIDRFKSRWLRLFSEEYSNKGDVAGTLTGEKMSVTKSDGTTITLEIRVDGQIQMKSSLRPNETRIQSVDLFCREIGY